jgi:putative sigma-54 modulation protein
MKTIIQAPNIKVRENLQALIKEKMEKLGSLNNRLIEARVCVKFHKSDTRDNKICEIQMVIPGNDLFATKHAKSFPEAVRKASLAMQRQISDWKLKVRPSRKAIAS